MPCFLYEILHVEWVIIAKREGSGKGLKETLSKQHGVFFSLILFLTLTHFWLLVELFYDALIAAFDIGIDFNSLLFNYI